MEDFTDKYGVCHTVISKTESFVNANGELKLIGSLQFWKTNLSRPEQWEKSSIGMLDVWTRLQKQMHLETNQFLAIFEQKINDQLRYNEVHDVIKNAH
jgi:hypothetical protein